MFENIFKLPGKKRKPVKDALFHALTKSLRFIFWNSSNKENENKSKMLLYIFYFRKYINLF
jgi:hypothetical protein